MELDNWYSIPEHRELCRVIETMQELVSDLAQAASSKEVLSGLVKVAVRL